MIHSPGTLYQSSGKLEYGNYFLFLLISIAANSLIGIGYGALSHINPLIYINFLILFGALMISIFAGSMFLMFSKSRSENANIIFLVVSSLFMLYNAWAGTIGLESYNHSVWDAMTFQLSLNEIMDFAGKQEMSIGKIGRSGVPLNGGIMMIFYFIEAAIILVAPAYLNARSSNYYCEECDSFMDNSTGYYTRSTGYRSFARESAGNFSELKDEQVFSESHMTSLPPKVEITKVEVSKCPKCAEAVIDVEIGRTKADNKKSEFKRTEPAIKGIYIDQETKDILFGSSANNTVS